MHRTGVLVGTVRARTHALVFAHVLIGALASHPAQAQWTTGGVGVAVGDSTEFRQAIASDGAGGAFVAWADGRAGAGSHIYLSRLAADGALAPGWPSGGLAVCVAAGSQTFPAIAPDGSGGCLLAWADYRSGIDVYVTRVLGDATIAPGWPADGEPVSALSGTRTEHALTGDGAGGVYVAWSDAIGSFDWDLDVQHFTSAGAVAAGWPAAGLTVSNGTGQNVGAALASDGAGGVFVAWQQIAADGNVWLQRLAPDGSLPAGWSAGGVHVFAALNWLSPMTVAAGGAGDCYVVGAFGWTTSNGLDVLAQRVSSGGAIPAGWPAGGAVLCGAAGQQQQVAAVADGSGGLAVAWQDLRASPLSTLAALRVDSTGSIGAWPVGGATLVPSGVAGGPAIALDGAGRFLTFVEDTTGGNDDLIAQGAGLDGSTLAGWQPGGNVVCGAPGRQSSPVATSAATGHAIVAWTDARAPSFDVYAAEMGTDGVVPARASIARASAWSDRVELAWWVPHPAGFEAAVERAAEDRIWHTVATLDAGGDGTLAFTDHDVVPGTRLGYRLADPGTGAALTAETWLLVPALGLALAPPSPDPADRALQVAFTLDRDGPVSLDLADAQGRVRARRDGVYAAGPHALTFAVAGLEPGVYFLRLRQHARALVRRVAIVR